MRHRKSFNHLGRTAPHRKAMLANMASSLIMHKRITTTTAKAKALRSYIEPLITKSKDDTTHSRRVVFSYLQDKDAVSELFRDVAGKIAERPGGYTRILKIGSRLGDSAEMAIIELVDYNELLLSESTQKTGSRRRRRGSSGKGKTATSDSSVVSDVETMEEEPKTPASKPTSASDEHVDSEETSADIGDKVAETDSEVAADASSEEAVTEKKQETAPDDEPTSEENSEEENNKA